MPNRFDTTGKTKTMRRMERATLVIQHVDPATLAANRPKPVRSPFTPAQQEQIALTGTIRTRLDSPKKD